MLVCEVSESYTNTDFLELDSSSVHGRYLQRREMKCIIKGKNTHTMKPFGTTTSKRCFKKYALWFISKTT